MIEPTDKDSARSEIAKQKTLDT